MTPWLAALVAALASVPADVEREGVRVEVSVRAHVYTWTVTNVSAPPITTFEVAHHNCYSERAPEGWEVVLERDRMRAWTDDPRRAIRPGRSGRFSAQVSSGGAVLGAVPLTIGFGPPPGTDQSPDPGTIRFDEVWGPVRMPTSAFVTIAVTIMGVAVLHALLLGRRSRGRADAVSESA